MHRLGGNEAPPAIMSVYLGEVLSQLLEEIKEGNFNDMPDKGELNLGLNRLPSVKVDNTDRNRTSPIAFTGNKFEFRATGASQSISGPLTMIVTLWCWGMERMAEMIEKRTDGGWDITDAALDAVRQAYKESSLTCFDGNCYSPEWREEAGKRGLPLADSTPEALALYLVPEHRKLLDSLGIMSDREIIAYYETRLEQFSKTVDIEMGLFSAMIWEGILPALSQQIGQEAQALHHLPPSMERETEGWREELHRLVRLRQGIMETAKRIDSLRKSLICLSLEEQARRLTDEGMPLYEGLRAMCDEVEGLVSLSLWPYPTYRDIFSLA
jgi:glutamine synthetase